METLQYCNCGEALLLDDAIGVKDTIWYSETETLRDAILAMIDMEISLEAYAD